MVIYYLRFVHVGNDFYLVCPVDSAYFDSFSNLFLMKSLYPVLYSYKETRFATRLKMKIFEKYTIMEEIAAEAQEK
jgi:hypothetical protein